MAIDPKTLGVCPVCEKPFTLGNLSGIEPFERESGEVVWYHTFHKLEEGKLYP